MQCALLVWVQVYNNMGERGRRQGFKRCVLIFLTDLTVIFREPFSMTRPRFFLNFKKIGAIFLVSPSVGSWADVRPMKTIGKERLFVWRMRTETLIFWYNHLPISVNKTLHNMVLINVIIRIYISFFPCIRKESKLTRLKNHLSFS